MLILRSLLSLIFLLASLAAGAIAYNFLFLFEKAVTSTIVGVEINSGYIASAIAVVLYIIALFLLPLGSMRNKSKKHGKANKDNVTSER